MKSLAVLMGISFFASLATAEDVSIINIQRNIPLSDSDPVYKDFYINAGESSGLKKNMLVTAFRKMGIKDIAGAQTFGEIEVPVGQLKIIALNNKVAIAREVKLISREEEAMLEQVGIMTGDRIDLKNTSFETAKPKAKAKKVTVDGPPPAEQALAAEPQREAASIEKSTPAAPTTSPTSEATSKSSE